MTTLNAAIIGAGAIHSSHVNALRLLPGVTLRALVDIDSANGLQQASRITAAITRITGKCCWIMTLTSSISVRLTSSTKT